MSLAALRSAVFSKIQADNLLATLPAELTLQMKAIYFLFEVWIKISVNNYCKFVVFSGRNSSALAGIWRQRRQSRDIREKKELDASRADQCWCEGVNKEFERGHLGRCQSEMARENDGAFKRALHLRRTKRQISRLTNLKKQVDEQVCF